MKFTDVCYITNDVIKLRAFYEAVFGVKAEGDAVHSWLYLAGLTFTFDRAPDLQEQLVFRYVEGGGANNVIVGFNVDDVDAEYERLLAQNVEMLNQPTTHSWGARSFQFKDPDGNILNFRSFPKEE
jgi:predicted enzyme related to lactoylglutathione lyase